MEKYLEHLTKARNIAKRNQEDFKSVEQYYKGKEDAFKEALEVFFEYKVYEPFIKKIETKKEI